MKVEIEVTLKADTQLLSALVALAAGLTGAAVAAPSPVLSNGKEEKPVTVKKEAPVKKIAAPAVATTGAGAPTETVEPSASSQPSAPSTIITIEELRAIAVPKSKAGHKDAIKAELTRLGAESLQDLNGEHFAAFKTFIEKL